MRIALCFLQSLKKHPIAAYHYWRRYLYEGCREGGHECLEIPGVDWAEGLTYPNGRELNAWRTRTWETSLDYLRREHARRPVHLFLSYLHPKQIEPGAIEELQRIGIPCANFFCDNVRDFSTAPAEYLPFAMHWVPEFEALPMYRQAGLPHLHAPMPCWVSPDLRTVPVIETEPPTFIGSADILRRHLLAQAIRAGADLVVRGKGWLPEDGVESSGRASRYLSDMATNTLILCREQRWGALCGKVIDQLFPVTPTDIPSLNLRQPVSEQDYARITREAIVTIGINRVPTARTSNRRPLIYPRLRDIEAPMLGACYITEWCAGLEELYDPGSEIETYRSPDELALKIAGLKQDQKRRVRLRERGQRRALHDHSIDQSLNKLLRAIAP